MYTLGNSEISPIICDNLGQPRPLPLTPYKWPQIRLHEMRNSSLSEVSRAQNDKYSRISLSWNLKGSRWYNLISWATWRPHLTEMTALSAFCRWDGKESSFRQSNCVELKNTPSSVLSIEFFPLAVGRSRIHAHKITWGASCWSLCCIIWYFQSELIAPLYSLAPTNFKQPASTHKKNCTYAFYIIPPAILRNAP